MLVHGLHWHLPLLGYLIISLILFPLRIRNVWKAGAKYKGLLLLPLTFVIIAGLTLLWHYSDILYLYDFFKGRIPLDFVHLG